MPNSSNYRQRAGWNGLQGALWAGERVRYDRMLNELGQYLLDAIDLQIGEQVLEIGCGCGGLTVDLAERAGSKGRVLGFDLSERMLSRASARLAGYENVQLICGDGQNHCFAPHSFDVLASRLGMTFFEDPLAALRRLHGACREDARLGFVCWQESSANQWVDLPWRTVAELFGVPMPNFDATPPFAFARAQYIDDLLRAAGFRDVVVTPLRLSLPVARGVEDGVAFYLERVLRDFLGQMPGDAIRRAGERLSKVLMPYAEVSGLILEGAAWLATARIDESRE